MADVIKIHFRIIKKDGSIAHISHICTPVFDDVGNLNGRRISNRDVTKQKMFEKKIEHLASFPELNPHPVIEIDISGKIIYANRSARESAKNIFGRESTERLLPENTISIIEAMLENKDEMIKIEVALNDSVFMECFSYFRSSDSFRIYMFDITQLRKAEKELLEAQEKLRQSAEKQLIESYKHIGKINRKISLITDLEKYCAVKREKEDIANFILTSAMNLCDASAGFLYVSPDQENFSLLSERTDGPGAHRNITRKKSILLKQLKLFKKRINGNIQPYQQEFLEHSGQLTYFVALPFVLNNSLRGLLFLGLENIISMDSEDLDFLDVFAKNATESMVKMKILE